MKHLHHLLVSAALLVAIVGHAQGQATEGKHLYNVPANHLAIEGYDPVAYFAENEAIEGKKEFSYTYDGVVYHFATAQHLQTFKANPQKYQPQYGGWCAYAMGAKGEKVDIDPETFKVLDGKLYLFYNRFFNNTKTSWDKDEANLKHKADINWQKITQ
jgi:YHS domain-containing protein